MTKVCAKAKRTLNQLFLFCPCPMTIIEEKCNWPQKRMVYQDFHSFHAFSRSAFYYEDQRHYLCSFLSNRLKEAAFFSLSHVHSMQKWIS